MSNRKQNIRSSEVWLQLHKQWQADFPHFASILGDANEFRELRVKMNLDGSCIAILKRWDSSGGPEVCFGSGYDPILALMSLDASVQGGNWRYDKPWDSGKEEK